MNEIVTHTRVPREHPSLPGHFPGRPIVPGVVLLNLVLEAIRAELTAAVTLQSIVSAKFLRACEAEQRIDMHIKLDPSDAANQLKARFTASHDSTPVLEGSFLLMVAGPAT
jgi:3-hydroxymyristoyl/3-hydroxydecanoyl-(acyl carrier protein) dehydratase